MTLDSKLNLSFIPNGIIKQGIYYYSWPEEGVWIYTLAMPSANRSNTQKQNMKHPMLLVSEYPSDRLGLKGAFRHILGWRCSTPNSKVPDQCSRVPGTGAHVMALAILLFVPTWTKWTLSELNLFDTRLKKSLQPKSCFNLKVFNDGDQAKGAPAAANDPGDHDSDDSGDSSEDDDDDNDPGPDIMDVIQDATQTETSDDDSDVDMDDANGPKADGKVVNTEIIMGNLDELDIKQEVETHDDQRSFIEAWNLEAEMSSTMINPAALSFNDQSMMDIDRSFNHQVSPSRLKVTHFIVIFSIAHH